MRFGFEWRSDRCIRIIGSKRFFGRALPTLREALICFMGLSNQNQCFPDLHQRSDSKEDSFTQQQADLVYHQLAGISESGSDASVGGFL